MVIAIDACKIAYMAVPKAACTSVKAALATIDDTKSLSLEDFVSGGVDPHTVYQTMRFRPHRWENYEAYWRFTVVRDPLRRLLSLYSDRILLRQELFNSPKMRSQSELPKDPDPDFFFENIERYKQLSSVVKHHALPTRLFIGPRPHRFDRVYRVDQIADLERDLSNRSGANVTVPKLNTSGTRLKFDDLKPETRQFLEQFLKEEYEDLAEYFSSPFG